MCLALWLQLTASLACCVTKSACQCCCKCCPTCRSSTSARLVYLTIFFLFFFICHLLVSPSFPSFLALVPGLCSGILGNVSIGDSLYGHGEGPLKFAHEVAGQVDRFVPGSALLGSFSSLNSTVEDIENKTVALGVPLYEGLSDCDLYDYVPALYSLGFVFASFFLLMAILMLNVKSSEDDRSGLQNGFWLVKILAIAGLMTISYGVIPWTEAIYYFALISIASTFALFQVLLIFTLDFSHSISKWILNRHLDECGEGQCGKYYVTALALIFFSLTAFIILGLSKFYNQASNCTLTKAFVVVNTVLIIFMIVTSAVGALCHMENILWSLPQPSIVGFFVAYLTWMAISHSPQVECNPSLWSVLENVTGVEFSDGYEPFLQSSYITLMYLLGCIIYCCIRKATLTDLTRYLVQGRTPEYSLAALHPENREERTGVWDDEEIRVMYSYSLLHFLLSLGCLYVIVVFTNWTIPSINEENQVVIHHSWFAMWLLILASWSACLIYTWTLCAPALYRSMMDEIPEWSPPEEVVTVVEAIGTTGTAGSKQVTARVQDKNGGPSNYTLHVA